jgi:predicted P-loop ATPase
MSQTKIKVRLPYGKNPVTLARRTSFIGSTNRTEFLSDETGSIRWICFEIDNIDFNYSTMIDINKVYSQAYHLLNSSEFNYELTAEEIIRNEEGNKQFQIATAEQELIVKYFCPGVDPDKFLTSTEILNLLVEITGKAIRLNLNNVGKALTFLGFERKSKRTPGQKHSYYGYYIKRI